MMGLDDWMNTNCECVQSELLRKHDHGAARTMECYTQTNILVVSESQNTIPKEQMIKIEEKVYFLTTHKDGMTKVALRTVLGDELSNNPPEQFPHEYLVLAARSNCLLVSYGESSDGMRNCLLWGLSREEVNTNTECYKKLELLCAQDTYDITESDNPCEQYDVNEPRR
ncbi:uncharacterized protein [Dermacentor andersoni]|uniref:uncharacterized protein n=1 Tax=Dermacentor andersoni TaxID=34620 RepID=UPI002417C1AC|nr:uncharacterized protein LOC129384248 [Dermacentor andersoni]